MESIKAFPLYWPEGWPRAKYHAQARFGDHSVKEGRERIESEVRLLGGSRLIISTNLDLNRDGLPRSGQRQPQDRGAAIFFDRNKVGWALACDYYTTVEDNLWALGRTVNALRQIERDGSPALIARAFKGFMALPDPDQKEWHQILGVDPAAGIETIKTQYFKLARIHHPDQGGDRAEFEKVTAAWEQAQKVKGR